MSSIETATYFNHREIKNNSGGKKSPYIPNLTSRNNWKNGKPGPSMFAWSQTITTFYVFPFQRIHESKTAVTVYFQDDLFLMILGSSEKT